MNVDKVMVKEVVSCRADSTADTVALAMWDHDCGCIPVVDEQNKPVGIVTDRDITMAAALQNRPLWEISASDITRNRKLVCCREGDEIHGALDAMGRNSVRRLPVVDGEGCLVGIVSLGDIMAVAGSGSRAKLPYGDTLGFVQAVSAHHMGAAAAPARVA